MNFQNNLGQTTDIFDNSNETVNNDTTVRLVCGSISLAGFNFKNR